MSRKGRAKAHSNAVLPICERCQHSCKQKAAVRLLQCPRYEPKPQQMDLFNWAKTENQKKNK